MLPRASGFLSCEDLEDDKAALGCPDGGVIIMEELLIASRCGLLLWAADRLVGVGVDLLLQWLSIAFKHALSSTLRLRV